MITDQNYFLNIIANQMAVSTKEPKAKAEEFERIEDKILVPVEYKNDLIAVIERHAKPTDLFDNTLFSTIESVYYDSLKLQSFRDHFQLKPSRFKLRTRRYAPGNGSFSDKTHLELKYKQGEVSHKFRFRLSSDDLQLLNSGKPIRISEKILSDNDKINPEELIQRAQIINMLVENFSLTPILRIVYCRNAYEDKGIRVTLDTNIRSELLRPLNSADLFESDPQIFEGAMSMASKFHPEKFVLLEVKHKGVMPEWLNAFFAEKGLLKTSFSKYCYSLTTQVTGVTANSEKGVHALS